MNVSDVMKKFIKKLQPFDIAFIAIAIVFLIIFYLVFKRQTVFITVRAKITEDNLIAAKSSPRDEFAIGFVVGDTEKDELGRMVSEIVNVESYKISPNEQVVYLDVKLKATYNPRKHIYSTKGKDILFGESFTFAFSKARFKGIIVDLPGLSEALHITNKKTVVKAQIRDESRQFSDVYGVPKYLADAVKEGDTVVDTKGNILAKMLEVKAVAAKRIVVTGSGQSITIDDTDLKDVYYTIELSTKEVNGKIYMFDYKPVLIGETIPLYTRHAALWPTITDIIE